MNESVSYGSGVPRPYSAEIVFLQATMARSISAQTAAERTKSPVAHQPWKSLMRFCGGGEKSPSSSPTETPPPRTQRAHTAKMKEGERERRGEGWSRGRERRREGRRGDQGKAHLDQILVDQMHEIERERVEHVDTGELGDGGETDSCARLVASTLLVDSIVLLYVGSLTYQVVVVAFGNLIDVDGGTVRRTKRVGAGERVVGRGEGVVLAPLA